MTRVDNAILQAALVGYTAELDKINAAMAAIRKELGLHGTRAAAPAGGDRAKPKHHISAAGRRAIAEAQRKRWAAVHKAAKKAAPKKKMSAERKAALVANLAKARAAKAARAATA
jgi:hypothetical protein